ncbi:AraC family transcriptional regulator [Antricoccus suffuscus]|uniref:AraC family transcriptional regulator n=1 Tax=Antricoccus suffuscus TaxID=1629062 RepID=A0A2T0ZYX8_9ACTN|nr:AraC family transcriptional regulator [Antricoccus suffuscus]PRZ41553.1 AraC family transcriptional regulator [Antricoccus suffuscus]
MHRLAVRRGIDGARCLDVAGIDAATLVDPNGLITMRQELAFIAEMLQAVDAPAEFGLEVGSRYRLTIYGVWGLAIISSATVRESINVANQFIDLTYACTRVQHRVGGSKLFIEYGDFDVPENVRQFVLARDIAGAHVIWAESFDPVQIDRCELRLPRPADTAPYERIFGVLPEFDSSYTRFTFDGRCLDIRLPSASPLTAEQSLMKCLDTQMRLRARRTVAGRVREELQGNHYNQSQERVAAALNLSVRTLRRQLADEGTSFRLVGEEVRMRQAEQYLAAGLSVQQVSNRVGYGDPSSFIRAFIRRNGDSPRRWTRSHEDRHVDA